MQVPVPKGKTVELNARSSDIIKRCQKTGRRGIYLLHGNFSTHKASIVMLYLR